MRIDVDGQGRNSIVFPGGKPHHACTHVEDGNHILQERMPQHAHSASAHGGSNATNATTVAFVDDHVLFVDVEGLRTNLDAKGWRDGGAGDDIVAAVIAIVRLRREETVDSVCGRGG